MAGQPKKTKLNGIRFKARRDGTTEIFSSMRAAEDFVRGGRRRSIEPVYFSCRFWVLTVERALRRGEESLDEESWTAHRLREIGDSIKGPDADELLRRASVIRRQSFESHWLLFAKPENLAQLPPESRDLALQCYESYYTRLDQHIEVKEAAQARSKAEREAAKREAAIPTVKQLFNADLDSRVKEGSIEDNSAATCRYEASAFSIEVEVEHGVHIAFGDLQVHKLTPGRIHEWFGKYSARPTRFRKPPSSKSCKNLITHVRAARRAAKKRDDSRAFATAFDVIDEIYEEVARGGRSSDGWRNRHRLTLKAVGNFIGACQTDLEFGAMVLMLAGSRPPSEPTACEWSHLIEDQYGNLWWHVCASLHELRGGVLDLRNHTKTGSEVDFRQLSIPKSHRALLEKLRGKSRFVLGDGDDPLTPSAFTELVSQLFERAGISGPGISQYSLRHTVSDEVERLLGRTARDLVLHARRDRTTAGLHYSHAEQERRWKELTFDGKPYGEHMVWAQVEFK